MRGRQEGGKVVRIVRCRFEESTVLTEMMGSDKYRLRLRSFKLFAQPRIVTTTNYRVDGFPVGSRNSFRR